MNAPVLLSLLRGMPDAGSHGASLDAFYAAQAEAYDGFREHLLHGREQMVSALAIGSDHRLLDVGGGTARNLEFIDPTVLAACASVEILDLCRPLLAIAKRRVVERGWTNVILTHADACRDEPVHASVDRVMFSYSLSMIPDWHLALDRAIARLRPGGLLGIADFHVSTVPPPACATIPGRAGSGPAGSATPGSTCAARSCRPSWPGWNRYSSRNDAGRSPTCPERGSPTWCSWAAPASQKKAHA